jgi:TRAP-type C4-dicarboxylate transport system substrate-binding protein
MEQIKCLAQGGIHLYVDEPHCFEPYSDICGVVFLPYFFNDRSHYYRFLESSIYENEIYQPLLQSGIRILNPRFYWEGGNFELLFSREPIFTPEDLKGKKIRTYSSKVAIELRNALGAKAVVVEWENVCDAFERGDIEVLLCPASYFSALQLHKVVKHATILRYGYTANLNVAMSEKEYIKLRPSIQQALVDAVETTGIYCSELANKQTEVDLVNLSARFGVPVIQPDATLWQSAFKKAIHHVCNKGFLDKGIYKNIQGL